MPFSLTKNLNFPVPAAAAHKSSQWRSSAAASEAGSRVDFICLLHSFGSYVTSELAPRRQKTRSTLEKTENQRRMTK